MTTRTNRLGYRGALALASTLAVLVTVTGCGGSFADADPAGTTTPSPTSASPTRTTIRSTTTTPTTTSTPRPSTSAPSTTTAASGSASGPLDSGAAGRSLTLNDFFEPTQDWEEQRYSFADRVDVQGIATQVAGCSSFYGSELELRLGNNFDTLTFSVAQENDSHDSDQNLSVEVVANNAQVDVRTVPFNLVQPFTIDVSGVNALKIHFVLDDSVSNCGGSVHAVLVGATLA